MVLICANEIAIKKLAASKSIRGEVAELFKHKEILAEVGKSVRAMCKECKLVQFIFAIRAWGLSLSYYAIFWHLQFDP